MLRFLANFAPASVSMPMRAPVLSIALAAMLFPAAPAAAQADTGATSGWSIAIHGGAGTIRRSDMSAEDDAAYRASLQAALNAGAAVLAEGGTAREAVIAVIVLLEDDPRFNAGRGAVLTWDGTVEHDAAIMTGHDLQAGAITGTRSIRHPILLADAVMEQSRHVFLSGAGAEEFAAMHDLETMPNEWFVTQPRRDALEGVRARESAALAAPENRSGTVGAVALDSHGNLAAGTSTGGLTGKRWGRIGDAPIIGAGTFADNRACAVSATGEGEYFIRIGVAREICGRMRLSGESADEAAQAVIAEVGDLGGTGGVIVLDSEGAAAYALNTEGMYRGRADASGTSVVAIYGDEAD